MINELIEKFIRSNFRIDELDEMELWDTDKESFVLELKQLIKECVKERENEIWKFSNLQLINFLNEKAIENLSDDFFINEVFNKDKDFIND